MNNTFFIAYTAYDGKVPRLNIATSSDLKNWQKHGIAFDDFDFFKEGGVSIKWENGKPVERHVPKPGTTGDRSKAGGIFPEKIKEKYWMMFNEFRIWLANSDDGIKWKALPGPFLAPRKNTDLFDNIHVEMGPPPIKMKQGWLVFYHGINDAMQYNLGILLLDLNDPAKILFRSKEPVFGPQEKYELSGAIDIIPGAMKLIEQDKKQKHELESFFLDVERKGFMPQVTFTSAAVLINDTIRLFYGASDQFICTATAPLEKIISTITS